MKSAGRVSVLLCLAALTAAASAQNAFDRDLANLALIKIPVVKKELKIAADQTRRMEALEKESAAAMDKLRKAATPPTHMQMQNLASAARMKQVAVLSSSQLKRLREITLQTLGPLGAMNPMVQEKLAISKTQKPKLEGLYKNYIPKLSQVSKVKDPKKKQTDADLKKRREAIDKLQRELAVGIRGVLTPDQLKQFRALVGKPCSGLQTAARVAL